MTALEKYNAFRFLTLPTGVIGPVPAVTVATQMLTIFPSIRFSLMAGIGGGVPSQADIRLGDVVVAKPSKDHGGVVQYGFPGTMQECTLEKTGMLNKPPRILLTALSKLQAIHLVTGNRIQCLLSEIETKYPLLAATLRPPYQDRLFRSDYRHPIPSDKACSACDVTQLLPRTLRHEKTPTSPHIHYGLIASGNQVIKDSRIRDHLARQSGILCFEMEAAGLLDNFPSLVIRGIADYADSRKNDAWQGYAAATAAAYAKELLWVIPMQEVEDQPLAVGFPSK
jgi:nucleoside phosphorylase